MRKLLYAMLALLLLSGCTVLKEDISPTSTPTALPSYSSTSAATLLPTFSATPPAVSSPTPSPTPLPSQSPALAIELIATAKLPGVEAGDWYEWDIAGNYPANLGDMVLIESQGLLAYVTYESKQLIICPVDNPRITILDDNVYGQLNYCDGWIYYMKMDGFWKIKTDGTHKHLIYSKGYGDNYFFIYDGRAYFWWDYADALESTNLEGEDYQSIKLPKGMTWYALFSDGYFYYCTADYVGETDSPTAMHLNRYSLETGKAQEYIHDAWGPLIASGGWIYYSTDMDGNLERFNGHYTEKLLSAGAFREQRFYNVFGNYLLYFNNDGPYQHDGTLCALDVHSGQIYELFDTSEISHTNIHVTQNSIFLYSSYYGTMIYRITFENDQAYLWRLNGLS